MQVRIKIEAEGIVETEVESIDSFELEESVLFDITLSELENVSWEIVDYYKDYYSE